MNKQQLRNTNRDGYLIISFDGENHFLDEKKFKECFVYPIDFEVEMESFTKAEIMYVPHIRKDLVEQVHLGAELSGEEMSIHEAEEIVDEVHKHFRVEL